MSAAYRTKTCWPADVHSAGGLLVKHLTRVGPGGSSRTECLSGNRCAARIRCGQAFSRSCSSSIKSHVGPLLFEPSCSQARPNCVGYRFCLAGQLEVAGKGPPNFRECGGPTQGKSFCEKSRPGRAGSVPSLVTGMAFSVGPLFVPRIGECWGFSRRAFLTRRPNRSPTTAEQSRRAFTL